MKKIMLAFVCCMMLLTGCGTKDGKIKDITRAQLQEKIENKDKFVVVVSRESCAHCQDLKEMLKDTIKKHDTIVYKYEMDESNMEVLVADARWMEANLVEKNPETEYSTPHIYYVDKGQVKDSFTGFNEDDQNQFWDFIKDNNLENAK